MRLPGWGNPCWGGPLRTSPCSNNYRRRGTFEKISGHKNQRWRWWLFFFHCIVHNTKSTGICKSGIYIYILHFIHHYSRFHPARKTVSCQPCPSIQHKYYPPVSSARRENPPWIFQAMDFWMKTHVVPIKILGKYFLLRIFPLRPPWKLRWFFPIFRSRPFQTRPFEIWEVPSHQCHQCHGQNEYVDSRQVSFFIVVFCIFILTWLR